MTFGCLAGIALVTGCKTAPDNLDLSAAPPASAVVAAPAGSAGTAEKKVDALSSCRATGSPKGVTWQCANDVVALDMQSERHDDAAEIATNLETFAEPFVGMGAARDNSDLVSGAARLRSVKVSGEKREKPEKGDKPDAGYARMGSGPIVARMAVVDQTPTRYVSCAAKRDVCDDVLRALLGRTAGAH
jgi:hypothetical protein